MFTFNDLFSLQRFILVTICMSCSVCYKFIHLNPFHESLSTHRLCILDNFLFQIYTTKPFLEITQSISKNHIKICPIDFVTTRQTDATVVVMCVATGYIQYTQIFKRLIIFTKEKKNDRVRSHKEL